MIFIKDRSAIIHIYVDEILDTTNTRNIKSSLLEAGLKASSGKLLCSNDALFLIWIGGGEKEDCFEHSVSVPAGTYLVDIHTIDTPPKEIETAIECSLGKRALKWLDRVEFVVGMTSCLAIMALTVLLLPLLSLVIASFWFPAIWKWLGFGALSLLLPLGLSIVLLSFGYFRRLSERRKEIILSFPDYIIVLRSAPVGFNPANAKAPIVESKHFRPIPKEL